MSHPSLGIASIEFVQRVVATRPAIAVFDCDGTLWWGDAGADFFYWEIEKGIVAPEIVPVIRQRYDEYLAGRVDELAICGEMIQINKGVTLERLRAGAREFFREVVAHRIFPRDAGIDAATGGAGLRNLGGFKHERLGGPGGRGRVWDSP